MRKRKHLKLVCVFMAALLLFLAGCSQTGQEGSLSQESDKVGTEDNKTGDDKTEGSKAEDNKTEDDTEENASAETEDTPVFMRADYSDKVLDRSQVEGKFAVYFLGSDVLYSSYSYTQKGGDSVLLIAPDGTTMLYDCFKPISAAYVVYALQELGITKIDYFVNSHPHVDHMGGFSLIARYFEIGHVYLPGAENAYENPGTMGGSCAAMMNDIKSLNIPYSYLVEGDSFKFGSDVSVKVYNPPANLDFDNIDANEWSLALKLVYKDASVLLAGDCGNNKAKLGRSTEAELAAKYGSELQADVSKCNHHGDGNVNGNTMAGSKEWIAAVNSKIYVACNNQFTDEKNYFTHVATGAEVYHTGLDGTVLVYTSGDGTYDVQLEMERNNPDYFGSTDAVDGHLTVK
ncbi:MAG: MBL fold metallo-hydrolase [Tyzzerella sp.]|nr:MBL fold metallo-hydrolase [Tyzzerella sp.]